MRLTGSKLESRYRYSRDLTYNTFIWPQASAEEKQHISDLGENIILMRENYLYSNLAELYNPETMPADIKAAHAELDLEVEKLYRSRPFVSDEERTSFMLELYATAIAREQNQ